MNLFSRFHVHDVVDMIVIEHGEQLEREQRLATINTRTGEIEILGRLVSKIGETGTLALEDLTGVIYQITLREMGIRQTAACEPFRSFIRTLIVPDELAKSLGF